MHYSQENICVLGSLFNKVTGLTVCQFLKQTPTQMFPVDIAKFLTIFFLHNTSVGCFWQSYHGTGKSAGLFALWFRASYTYYHVTKQFFPCLIWLGMCFRFQNIFWKNINCFWFWQKTYTKRCRSNYVIARVKRMHIAVGHVLSISGYNLENRTWLWKFRFWFHSVFVYFADLKTI